jgi:hypothetical protein
MKKFTLDDIQVKEAKAEMQLHYKQIAELKTLEDPILQSIARDTIKFLEFKIKVIDQALWKAGLSQFVLKKDMELSA